MGGAQNGNDSECVVNVTVRSSVDYIEKFELINHLLANEDLGQHEYVILVDDDIWLQKSFLDDFLLLQE